MASSIRRRLPTSTCSCIGKPVPPGRTKWTCARGWKPGDRNLARRNLVVAAGTREEHETNTRTTHASSRGISLRLRQSQRLFGPPGDPGHRRAHRRGLPLCADPIGRRLQADQQSIADAAIQGHQEQVGLPAARGAALHQKHGLTRFQMNPNFPVNTVQIMRAAVAAEPRGVFARYVEVVFTAMWEEGKKMDDAEVIRATLDAAGLDGGELLASIQEQSVKDALIKATEASVARGTFGAPTFYVGEEIYFGKDSLGAVEEAITAANP